MPFLIPRSGIYELCLATVAVGVAVPLLCYGIQLRRAAGPGAAASQRPARRLWTALRLQAGLTALAMTGAAVAAGPLRQVFGARAFFFLLWLLDHYLFYALPALIGTLLLTGWILAPAARRESPRLRGGLLAAAVLLALLGVEVHLLGPRRLVVEDVSVPVATERHAGEPIRIAVISDLQTDEPGDFEAEVIARTLALAPDLILMPGDFIQESAPRDFERLLPVMTGLLQRLHAPHGVYAVDGDWEDPARLQRLVAGTRIRALNGEVVTLEVRGQLLHLYGLGNAVPPSRIGSCYRRLRRRTGDRGIHVLFTHQPDIVYALPTGDRPHLIVAGHTHGGQVRLPGFGALVNFQRLPLAYSSGLHTVGGQRLYVTRGIGMERFDAPRVRFFCPPEITLITLTVPAGLPAGASSGADSTPR